MAKVPLKKPKTFDEQIELLESRGLLIEDKIKTKFILQNINYYRFTAYLINFKNEDDSYVEGTTFNEVYSLYKFDKRLRILLIDLLSTIEISFRTYIAYTLAVNHGEDSYLDRNNFKNKDIHNTFICYFENEKIKNKDKEFIKHHYDVYEGKLPVWVAVEIITFGNLVKLYGNLLAEDVNFIKNNFCNVNNTLLSSWLNSMCMLRNHCAHYGRIYNRNFPMIKIKNTHKKHKLKNTKIFAYILAMKYLIADSEIWNNFLINLKELINNYIDFLDLNLIGFPDNWEQILSE